MRKSAKKQLSQVQTIQRTVISRIVTQDNDNTNNFWKGSGWFCRQCLRAFAISCGQNQENGCVWKTTFVSEHLNTDLSQLTMCFSLVACFACWSLGDLS